MRNNNPIKTVIINHFLMFSTKIIATLLLFTLFTIHINAQSNPTWKGKKAAVVLTYDDAIDQHLDHAVPVLDALGLKATFYITAYSTSMQNRMDEWKTLSQKGHELGNHTLYHPCVGGPGRTWLNPDHDMRNYSVGRMEDEIRMTNVFLKALDGKDERTFAYTCGDMKIGDSLFINGLKDDFMAARAVRNEMHRINDINLYNVDCYMVNGETGPQLIAWAKKAIATNSLLVVLFHGVGGGNALDVSLAAHKEFLEYLKNNEKDIWVAPMLEVADYIKQHQLNN